MKPHILQDPGRDWMIIDRLEHDEPVEFGLQHGEAIDLAREWSEADGLLLRDGLPADRYAAALGLDKIRARTEINTLPDGTKVHLRGQGYIIDSEST